MAAIYSEMGVTAGIFLASILLKEMRYLVYTRYLWCEQTNRTIFRTVPNLLSYCDNSLRLLLN